MHLDGLNAVQGYIISVHSNYFLLLYEEHLQGYFFIWFIFFRIRLCSHGTSKEGESYLRMKAKEHSSGMYSGLHNRSSEVVKFDTTKNRSLAAEDEYQINFWDMDNINISYQFTQIIFSCFIKSIYRDIFSFGLSSLGLGFSHNVQGKKENHT